MLARFLSTKTNRKLLHIRWDKGVTTVTLKCASKEESFTVIDEDLPKSLHLRDIYILAIICSQFTVQERVIYRHQTSFATWYNKFLIQGLTSPAWIKIQPLIHTHTRVVRSQSMMSPAYRLMIAHRVWDLYMFREYKKVVVINKKTIVTTPLHNITREYLEENVFKRAQMTLYNVEGLDWVPKKVPTLKAMILQSLSSYNRIFTGDRHGPYSCYSISGMQERAKMQTLIAKHTKDTSRCVLSKDEIRHVHVGMQLMYNQMGVREQFRTQKWHWDSDDVMRMRFNQDTSSGICPGTFQTYSIDGVKIVHKPYGKKRDVEYGCKKKLIYAVESYKIHGQIDRLYADLGDILSTLTQKPEYFNAWVMNAFTAAEREAMYDKCRGYFICFFLQFIVDTILQSSRHHVEQGDAIRIGTVWEFGGAEAFAKYMRMHDPNYEIDEGDIQAMDTSMRKNYMEFYYLGGSMYIDFAGMEPIDVRIYKALLQWGAEKLAVKILRISDDLWVVMKGGLPSGVFDTSHCGSWVVLLLIWAYYASLMEGPEGVLVRNLVMNDHVRPAVYGDDNATSRPKILHGIASEAGFGAYLQRAHGMVIKTNTIRTTSGYTRLDANHNITYRGAVFLRKLFVQKANLADASTWHPETADVLAFRHYSDYYHKVCFGVNRTDVYDIAAAIIGLAYDNSGVCCYAHHYLSLMYDVCREMTSDDLFPQGVKKAIVSSRDMHVRKYLFRKGKPLEKLTGEMPTLEYLRCRHIRDETKYKKRYKTHSYAHEAYRRDQ
jgi:hypothetical protein